jgi:hypothetical protein
MKKLLFLLLLFASSSALGQGIRVDLPPIINGQGKPIANVQVTVCTSTATGFPCSPQASTFTDGTLGTACGAGFQVTLTNTNVCQSTSDSLGNAGFWLAPGNYRYTLTGPNLTPQLYNLTIPSTSGATPVGNSLAACYASLPASGGTCIVPANYSETLSANLTMGKNNAGFLFMGPATITMGTNQIIIPAGTSGGFIKSMVPGTFNFLQGVVFVYSGTTTAISVGSSSSAVAFLGLENFQVYMPGAGSAAHGIDLFRVIEYDIKNIYVVGTGTGAITQQGFHLDGTGGFEGNQNFFNCHVAGTLIGWQFLGNASNNTFHIGSMFSNIANSIAFDVQNGALNHFLGPDLENLGTAYNFANNAGTSGNYVWGYVFNNTVDYAFGAASSNNRVEHQTLNAPIVTRAGTNNTVWNANKYQEDELGNFQTAGRISAGGVPAVGSALGDTTSARSANTGVYYLGSDGATFLFRNGGASNTAVLQFGGFQTLSLNSAGDTGITRVAANQLGVGNGTDGDVSGMIQAAALESGGSNAALTGTGACATFSTQTGGAMSGRFTCTGTTGASTITITPGKTAANGWWCLVQDETTRANLAQQTSTVAASCTLTATSITQNDVLVFHVTAF